MENCKGCHIKDNCIYNIKGISETTKCPCGICLIKAICVVICNDYREFADKSFNVIMKRIGHK